MARQIGEDDTLRAGAAGDYASRRYLSRIWSCLASPGLAGAQAWPAVVQLTSLVRPVSGISVANKEATHEEIAVSPRVRVASALKCDPGDSSPGH